MFYCSVCEDIPGDPIARVVDAETGAGYSLRQRDDPQAFADLVAAYEKQCADARPPEPEKPAKPAKKTKPE